MASRVEHIQQGPLLKPSPPPKGRKKARDYRSGMDPDHLANVRQLWCAQCSSPAPVDPHHCKRGLSAERGMGLAATDRNALPLCRLCHDCVEGAGSKNEPKSYRYLAQLLWANKESFEDMQEALTWWQAATERWRG